MSAWFTGNAPATPESITAEVESARTVYGPRRTHPLTPLITGWKVLAGIVAVIFAQNISQLANGFTWERALLGLGILVAVLLLAVLGSALSWWRTTYEITEEGVTLRSGLLTLSRRIAPRERIESVSVERPLLARLLGLAKVRVEMAGGGESHLDLAYVTAADAEEIRLRILGVAARGRSDARAASATGGIHDGVPTAASSAGVHDAAAEAGAAALEGTGTMGPGALPHADVPSSPAIGGRLRSVLHDGVTEGELIAEIPTLRLIRSIVRDVSLLVGAFSALLWTIASLVLALRENGFGIAFLAIALPGGIALLRMAFSRVESGWGFVSRDTPTGLRMRRGLLNTRTDNIGAGRVQDITLRRPLLWRGPGWAAASLTVAGIDGEDEKTATSVLPVGTREELSRTLGHLLPPLGTPDDLAQIEHLLTAPARSLRGTGPVHRLFPIARRTRRAVLLPGALALRSGIFTRRLVLIPRERLQTLRLAQGPLQRRLGAGSLTLSVAGSDTEIDDAPFAELLELRDILARDAAAGRRYSERDSWPTPPLASRASAPEPAAAQMGVPAAGAPLTVSASLPGPEHRPHP